MRLDSLNDVLVDQVSDLYDAERQLVTALPKMTQAANAAELREALEMHLEETNNHVQRLEQVFQKLGIGPTVEHCDGMEGLLREGEKVMQSGGDPTARDAALIAGAQRVEHYEIAGYGTARTLASELGLEEVSDLLNQTLDEESAADSKLTSIATGGMFRTGVNERAASAR